jgi:nitrate reductase gamma subunit
MLTGWKSTSPVHREVFGGIPGPLIIAFYTVIPMMLIWGSLRFADRIRNWERGAPDDRRTTPKNVKRRLKDFRAGVYMRTLLRDSAAGLMHSMMYFGFLVLLGVTTVLEIDHQMPESLKFLHGDVYRGYALIGDVAGLVFTGGVVWAIVRRYVQRPYRIRIKSKPEHAWILGVMLAIGVSGYGAEMFRIASEQAAGKNIDYEKWRTVHRSARCRPGIRAGGCFTSSPSLHSWPCCPSQCCATSLRRHSTCTCVTVTDQKVRCAPCRTWLKHHSSRSA